MKDQKIGVSTFLPLDSIEVRPVKESLRKVGGSFRMLIDVLDFDESVKNAILYACGDALVCETLEEARNLCYSSKVISRCAKANVLGFI